MAISYVCPTLYCSGTSLYESLNGGFYEKSLSLWSPRFLFFSRISIAAFCFVGSCLISINLLKSRLNTISQTFSLSSEENRRTARFSNKAKSEIFAPETSLRLLFWACVYLCDLVLRSSRSATLRSSASLWYWVLLLLSFNSKEPSAYHEGATTAISKEKSWVLSSSIFLNSSRENFWAIVHCSLEFFFLHSI